MNIDKAKKLLEQLNSEASFEDVELLDYEARAYNYLIEPVYEDLPFSPSTEGERLFDLCISILESTISRLGI